MSSRSLLIIFSLFASLGVPANSVRADPADRFARIDANGDGALSLQELERHALARFASADANRDGKVTAEERSVARERRSRERFAERDINRDGVLERAELEEMPKAQFWTIDTDKSGGISINEMRGFTSTKRMNRGLLLDTDGDGSVDGAELLSKVRARFVKLDTNRDGKLEPDEFAAGRH